MLPESGYYFLITHVTQAPAGWPYISANGMYVHNQATVFSVNGFVSVAVNANYLRGLVSEEALTTSTSPYAFVDRSDFILTLIFKEMRFFPCGAAARRGSWPPYSWGFLITRNDAPNSVGLFWTSDQLVAETCTWHHTTLTTDTLAPGDIRNRNPTKQEAADPCLRPAKRPKYR